MNNLKCQYLVGECMIDFPITTRNPSYANSWIYLPDSMIKVDVKHSSPLFKHSFIFQGRNYHWGRRVASSDFLEKKQRERPWTEAH
jgi:hypothetical protein